MKATELKPNKTYLFRPEESRYYLLKVSRIKEGMSFVVVQSSNQILLDSHGTIKFFPNPETCTPLMLKKSSDHNITEIDDSIFNKTYTLAHKSFMESIKKYLSNVPGIF